MRYYILNIDHSIQETNQGYYYKNCLGINVEVHRFALTRINACDGPIYISTVFLGVDHSGREEGPPLIFETIIMQREFSESIIRYETWDDALKGHTQCVYEIANPKNEQKLLEHVH